MKCLSCGAEIPDNVAFCTNCGTRIEAPAAAPQQNAANDLVNPTPTPIQAPPQAPGMPPQGAGYYRPPQPMSIGGWIGRYLIQFIPFVGGIVYLIMLFIWMGDTTKDETFRNWAKAKLILIAIGIALVVIIFVIFGAAIMNTVTNYYYY